MLNIILLVSILFLISAGMGIETIRRDGATTTRAIKLTADLLIGVYFLVATIGEASTI